MSRLQNISEYARAQAATAQTDQTLVTGVAGQEIWVHGIIVSSAAAGVVTLEQGTTTRMFEVYPGANGGISAISTDPDSPIFELTAASNLTWTSTITGNHYVHVMFTRR
jgi:hypothetical protein